MGFIVIKLSIDSETIDGHGDDGIFFFFYDAILLFWPLFFFTKIDISASIQDERSSNNHPTELNNKAV